MEIAPMTKRDKILLYVVSMFAFIVLFVRFLLIPGIENHQQAAADLTEAQDAQIAMQDTIMKAGFNANTKNTNWGELQSANALYYSILTSDELDTLVTGLELNHSLQPTSLNIGQPATQNLSWYIASESAGQGAAPSAGTTAAVTADLIPDYDQPGYFKTAAVTFSCTGSDTDFIAMLDDLAAGYPSVQLQTFTISTRSYANPDGTSEEGSVYTVSLNVILCDKGGVQP